MKAIRFAKLGGPEVLELQDVELPPPGPGQVQVRHTAIGVNFIDTYFRSGLYPAPLPATLGGEAAGVVDAVGEGVAGFKPGQRVGYCTVAFCAYAEAANIPADRLVKLPDGLGDEEAAAAMLKGMTAQYLLKRTFPVQKGQTILWHAAAGGVGLIACQWAKHLGATVIGTVGSDEKVQLARDNGCAHVLNTRRDDWVKQVREITGGEGVPVVYDSIGKDTLGRFARLPGGARHDGQLRQCLRRRAALCAGHSQPEGLALCDAARRWPTTPAMRQKLQETADDLFDVIARGIVKIAVNQRFALADAKKAHEALHSRQTTGATVLIP